MGTEPYFLSVDADFFDVLDHKKKEDMRRWLDRMTEVAHGESIPVSACMNHQQMLPVINNSRARHLVNLDQHSDLDNHWHCKSLHCGSWVNYVKWRFEGSYMWVRTGNDKITSMVDGDCGYHFDAVPGTPDALAHQWGTLKDMFVWEYPDPGMMARGAMEIMVCMSPAFSYWTDTFREWVRDHDIPYKKGRIMEDQSVNRRPR